MTLTPLRLAVALALTAGTAAAQASTTILDTTTTSGLSNKTFAGTASWNYGSAFDLDLTLFGSGTATYSWTLSFAGDSDTGSYSVTSSPGFMSGSSWTDLAAGAYTFSYSGTVKKGSSAGLMLVSSIAPITAVPEPETYAMLLAGLGIMGSVVRRRSKR